MSAHVLEWGSPRDLAAVLALERLCSPHPWSEALCAAALGAAGGTERTLVVRAPLGPSPGVVGFCVLAIVPAGREAEVRNVAVHPERRRRGLARFLLRAAIDRARDAGAETVFLEVRESNHAARALYSSLGFAETGRRAAYYADPCEDAVLMALGVPHTDVDTADGVRYPSSEP
jgi:ribosomal-protein-alanine N-acetyltransferase